MTCIHSGRRKVGSGAGASTPAGGEPAEQPRPGAPAPSPRENALEVVRRLVPRDVLALDRRGSRACSAIAVDDRVGDRRASAAAVAEELRHRRDAPVADAARDDVVEHREVGIDVEREAVTRAHRRDLHADRGDLLVADPHAGEPVLAVRVDAEAGERVDQRGFEPADVRDDVGRAVAPLRQRDDRVADELAGPVVRDVAAAVGVHELRADARRRHEHVRGIGARAERVDVRVLEQQQVVVGRCARAAPAAASSASR